VFFSDSKGVIETLAAKEKKVPHRFIPWPDELLLAGTAAK
jgi:hypothetical protein